MRKRSKLVVVSVATLLLGWVAVHFGQNREPRFEGKTLTQWLEEYRVTERPSVAGSPSRTLAEVAQMHKQYQTATNAVGQIGTNAIPLLLKKLSATDTGIQKSVTAWADRHGLFRFRVNTAEGQRALASDGFLILGQGAASAVPDLIKLISHPDRDVQERALWSLYYIHPNAETLLPALLLAAQDPDAKIRSTANWISGLLYPQEAEKIGGVKTIRFVKTNNVSTNVLHSK